MRVTKASVFVHAILVAAVGLVGAEWGLVAGAVAICAALLALFRAPRLVPVRKDEHMKYVKTVEMEWRHGIPDGGSSLPDLYRIEPRR